MGILKYIKTKYNKIVLFSTSFKHDEFKHFDPISAGFVNIEIDNERNINCTCYGESFSLSLKSEYGDSLLVEKQILNF